MRQYNSSFFIRLLKFALGAFFIILGIAGIFREFSESIFSLKSGYSSLEIVFGITEIICGLLLLLGSFLFANSRPIYWGGFIVFIFWVSRIVLSKFIWGLDFISDGNVSIPKLFQWLLVLSSELIIGAALMTVIQRYD